MVSAPLSLASSLTHRRSPSPYPKPTLLPLLITTFTPHHPFNSTKSTPKVEPRQPHLSFPYFVNQQCKSGFTKLQDARNLFDQMLWHKPTLSIRLYNGLFGAISKRGNFSAVISFYRRMMGTVDVEPDIYTFSILINCLGKLNQMRLGFSVLGVIFRHGYTPDHVTFGTFLKGYCIEGKIDKAMVLFRRCEKIGTRFDVVSYGAIIDGLCKNGKLDLAVEMLREMETKKRISPDIVIYNSLIDGMCNEERCEEANGYFKEMLDHGISPDLTTYNILINALCKDKKLEEAREMMSVMISQGIEPDVVTFSSLIHGYCLGGSLKDAVETFNMMIHGESKDVLTENSLLDELHKNQLSVPIQLLHVVENKKLRPDIVTYNILIAGMLKHGQVNSARELFNSICTKGLKPDSVTYNSMIDGYCKQGMMEEADELFLQMELKGYVSEIPFNALIHGYCSCGRIEDAVKVFNVMVSKDCEPNLITYNTLIDGFCKIRNPDEAARLFSLMLIHCKRQELLTEIILPDELHENQLVVAMQLFREIKNKKLQPDTITYSTLIAGMLKYGHLNNARKLFNLISTKGLKPSSVTYNIMINGFCKVGMLEEAKKLYQQMEEGCTPDENSYKALEVIFRRMMSLKQGSLRKR